MDKFVKNKIQPSIDDTQKWTIEMLRYSRDSWEEALNEEENEIEEVLDDNYGIVQDMEANVVSGRDMGILNEVELNQRRFPTSLSNNDLKVAAWSIKGICNKEKQKGVKKLIGQENISVCAVLETRIKEKNGKSVQFCIWQLELVF